MYSREAMNERAKRQSFLGEASGSLLSRLRVGIVGLGGGGSHVAQQLAHIGVGHFVLLDPDRIEESNLNRLVGATVDDVQIQEWKVRISSRTIQGLNAMATIDAVTAPWQERAELLRDCDLVFGCLDSFATRSELERMARRYLLPYIDIGMDVHQTSDRYLIVGQVALSMPGEVCLWCMNVLRNDLLAQEAAQYGAAGGRPQVVWANGILASAAVGIMMQLTTPWHKEPPPCLLEYDGNRNEVKVASSVPFVRTMNCPHFSHASDLGDPWYERTTAAARLVSKQSEPS
jgi:hypothetical protein